MSDIRAAGFTLQTAVLICAIIFVFTPIWVYIVTRVGSAAVSKTMREFFDNFRKDKQSGKEESEGEE